jgi:hypothetical protein
MLGQNKIIALTFPAHTTNLCQALDLVFLGTLKHFKATAAGEFGDDSVNAQITKITPADEQTATTGTIRRSFRKAGMIPDTATRSFKIRVDEDTMRQSPCFEAISEGNVSIDD